MERKPIESPTFFIGKGDGDGSISFGSGQPDLPPPQEVFEATAKFDKFKYGPIQGDPKLRKALASQYPLASPDQIVITNGASEAIDLTLRALSIRKPGSTVLLPRPYYYSYPENARIAQMEAKYYDLENGKLNMDNFRRQVQGCDVLIINSPSNPLGTILEIENLKEIERICEELGIYIISDEVYKDLIYERKNYNVQGRRVIAIGSFSKSFSMCGERVGHLFAHDPELVQEILEIKNASSMNTGIRAQAMAVAATRIDKQYLADRNEIFRERRDLIYRKLQELGLEVAKPEGAFYVFPKCPRGITDGQMMEDLYYDYGMIVYKGEWFGAPGNVRLSYALDTEKILEGVGILRAYLKQILQNRSA